MTVGSRPSIGPRLSTASQHIKLPSGNGLRRPLKPSPAQHAFGIGIVVPRSHSSFSSPGSCGDVPNTFGRRVSWSSGQASFSRRNSVASSCGLIPDYPSQVSESSTNLQEELEVQCRPHEQEDFTQWPSSVQGLLDSVSTSSMRMQKSGVGFRSRSLSCGFPEHDVWPSIVNERLSSSPSLAFSNQSGLATAAAPVTSTPSTFAGLGHRMLQMPPLREPLLQPQSLPSQSPPKRGGHTNEFIRRCTSSPMLPRGVAMGAR